MAELHVFANSGDLDQMLHSVVSDQGLHYFPVTGLGVSSLHYCFIVLGFKDMSTIMGHFASSPREKRDRRGSRGDEREGQGRKRKMNESEETEEIKTSPPLSFPAARIAGLAQL